jgi:hypothetical protein
MTPSLGYFELVFHLLVTSVWTPLLLMTVMDYLSGYMYTGTHVRQTPHSNQELDIGQNVLQIHILCWNVMYT